jgi:hypothetical protein
MFVTLNQPAMSYKGNVTHCLIFKLNFSIDFNRKIILILRNESFFLTIKYIKWLVFIPFSRTNTRFQWRGWQVRGGRPVDKECHARRGGGISILKIITQIIIVVHGQFHIPGPSFFFERKTKKYVLYQRWLRPWGPKINQDTLYTGSSIKWQWRAATLRSDSDFDNLKRHKKKL